MDRRPTETRCPHRVLKVIADWRDDLDERLVREHLKRTVIGIDVDKEHDLEVEATEFKSVCSGVIDSLRQRRRR